MTFLRHLFAFLALPFVAAIVIPAWLARRNGIVLAQPNGAADVAWIAVSSIALGIGVALFVTSLVHFVTRGRGTLAPWDPPKRLVVTGPYRYVRNPMISGVLFILAAQAMILRSVPHAKWAALFAVINLLYIPLVEEPMLEARFGDEYREYRLHVRRIWPRLRPWTQPSSGGESDAAAL